jgi:hypothetical protein
LEPGAFLDVALAFTAKAPAIVAPGLYATTLQVNSNDPDGPVMVPVEMLVRPHYQLYLPVLIR